MEHQGKPDVTGRELKDWGLIRTDWKQLVIVFIHFTVLGSKFDWAGLSNKHLWGILSNAFAKSSKMAPVQVQVEISKQIMKEADQLGFTGEAFMKSML